MLPKTSVLHQAIPKLWTAFKRLPSTLPPRRRWRWVTRTANFMADVHLFWLKMTTQSQKLITSVSCKCKNHLWSNLLLHVVSCLIPWRPILDPSFEKTPEAGTSFPAAPVPPRGLEVNGELTRVVGASSRDSWLLLDDWFLYVFITQLPLKCQSITSGFRVH